MLPSVSGTGLICVCLCLSTTLLSCLTNGTRHAYVLVQRWKESGPKMTSTDRYTYFTHGGIYTLDSRRDAWTEAPMESSSMLPSLGRQTERTEPSQKDNPQRTSTLKSLQSFVIDAAAARLSPPSTTNGLLRLAAADRAPLSAGEDDGLRDGLLAACGRCNGNGKASPLPPVARRSDRTIDCCCERPPPKLNAETAWLRLPQLPPLPQAEKIAAPTKQQCRRRRLAVGIFLPPLCLCSIVLCDYRCAVVVVDCACYCWIRQRQRSTSERAAEHARGDQPKTLT